MKYVIGQDWSSLWKHYKDEQRDCIGKLNQKLVTTPCTVYREVIMNYIY